MKFLGIQPIYEYFKVQNGYKCGVCGDNWKDSRPRPNELGGTFGSTGIIPRTYESNGIMPVSIQLTTHHQGRDPRREKSADQEIGSVNGGLWIPASRLV